MDRPAPPPPVVRLRILLWRLRALGAVLGLVVLAVVVARMLAPPPPATVAVLVAARALDAGGTLTDADVRVVRLAACCVPDGVQADPGAFLGRELAVAVPPGLPLVEHLLRGPRFAVDPPSGSVVVPVLLAEGSAATLLRVGDRVDLVGTQPPPITDGTASGDPSSPLVLAHAALVVDVPDPAEPGLLTGPGGTERPVLVAVSPAEGHALAAQSGGAPLGAVLVE